MKGYEYFRKALYDIYDIYMYMYDIYIYMIIFLMFSQ